MPVKKKAIINSSNESVNPISKLAIIPGKTKGNIILKNVVDDFLRIFMCYRQILLPMDFDLIFFRDYVLVHVDVRVFDFANSIIAHI